MQLKATLAAGLAALAMGVNAQEPTITSISYVYRNLPV
jgi:hypothetical protein